VLSFVLDHSSQEEWTWGTDRWASGSTWIRPYRHAMIEHEAVTDGRSSFIVVRERTNQDLPTAEPSVNRVSTEAYEALKAQALAWPLEFFLVERAMDGSFHLRTGHWGTAPVYLTEARYGLEGSWALPDLRHRMRLAQLNPLVVARALVARHRYSSDTLFSGIHQLTERARAEYSSAHGLVLHYPDPAVHARPRALNPDVDPIEVYEHELAQAVNLWPYASASTAVELSGGMDSANVAMSLTGFGIWSYALMLDGDVGRQQDRRRQDLVDAGGFRDFHVPAIDHPPLSLGGARALGDPLNPFDEPYHEAVEHILTVAGGHGITTVFTGDGGDELLSLRGAEWAAVGKIPGRLNPKSTPPTWLGHRAIELVDHVNDNLAPATVINESTLLGFACRTPLFMTSGMWPLSPLCSPRLIRFAEQLPADWRHDKRIARERLRRLGFTDYVVNPPLRENFTHVMEHGLLLHSTPLLEKILPESALVDLGYVSPDRLRAAHDEVVRTGKADTSLYAFLSLELGLGSLLG
jgi:asparagine synthase (glutamine-hydrolysing)